MGPCRSGWSPPQGHRGIGPPLNVGRRAATRTSVAVSCRRPFREATGGHFSQPFQLCLSASLPRRDQHRAVLAGLPCLRSFRGRRPCEDYRLGGWRVDRGSRIEDRGSRIEDRGSRIEDRAGWPGNCGLRRGPRRTAGGFFSILDPRSSVHAGKKRGRRPLVVAGPEGRMRGIGSRWEAAGESGHRGYLKGVNSSRTDHLQPGTTAQAFAQAPAAFQVAEHRLRQHVHGLGILRPLQLLLARAQMLEQVLEPQKVGITLAHTPTYLSGRHLDRGNVRKELQSPCRNRRVLAVATVTGQLTGA